MTLLKCLLFLTSLVTFVHANEWSPPPPPTLQETIGKLKSEDPQKSALAVQDILILDPKFENAELKQALAHALENPVLPDYLFLDTGQFLKAVVGYFPQWYQMSNMELFDAIEEDNWKKANMGFYFLQVKDSKPLKMDGPMLTAISLFMGQMIETGKLEAFPKIIPMMNAMWAHGITTPTIIDQASSLMLLLVKHFRQYNEVSINYYLGRIEGLIELGRRQGHVLKFEKVEEIYKALRNTQGITTRALFDSTDSHTTRWLNQFINNYDMVPVVLDFVQDRLQNQTRIAQHWNRVGYASSPRGRSGSEDVSNAWNILERASHIQSPQRINEFLKQPANASLADYALEAAPQVLIASGYILSESSLVRAISNYMYGVQSAQRWGRKARGEADKIPGVAVISSMADLAQFAKDLKSDKSRANMSEEKLRTVYEKESELAYRTAIEYSLKQRIGLILDSGYQDNSAYWHSLIYNALSERVWGADFGIVLTEAVLSWTSQVTKKKQIGEPQRKFLNTLFELENRLQDKLSPTVQANMKTIRKWNEMVHMHPLARMAYVYLEKLKENGRIKACLSFYR